MKRLGIVSSHPIQYYGPLFRYLAKTIDLVVFYCHQPSDEEIGKDGFGEKFQWDTDLLSGYNYVYLRNVSKKPSLSHFMGCDTPEIGQVLKEHKISHVVIMGWYLKSFIQALIQAKNQGIKVAVRGDSQLNPKNPFYKRFLKTLFYPFLLARYDRLLYAGSRNKSYLLEYGAKESQLIFSPHAVDPSFWKREQTGNPDHPVGKTIFIWIGKFMELKRPLDAIRAFLLAYAVDSSMELWMIGSGELMDSSRTLANQHPAIQFMGFKNQVELKLLLAQADSLLLTSDLETWGLVVNESFSMGIPAIISEACGSCPDMIDEGKTGFSYKTGNVKDLRDKILRMHEGIKKQYPFIKGIEQKNKIYSCASNQEAFAQFLNL
jgi:glycosyltransferase involved in cell wall biosynthesis